jgi:membrane-associated phospholipid phosphatase
MRLDRPGSEPPAVPAAVAVQSGIHSSSERSPIATPMIRAAREPFVAWPGWPHLRFTTQLILLVGLWFGLVFVGADWLTAHHAARVRVHLDAELRLPLLPIFLVVYMSLYLLFLAVPFVLRTRREAASLAIAQFVTILAAGVGFLLIPGQLAYASPGDLGGWGPLFHFADRLNLDYNLVPSLHVAMSIVCIEAFARYASPGGKVALRSWGLLIAASTLLTHQHHLLDVVTGYGLAMAVAARGTPGCKQHGAYPAG